MKVLLDVDFYVVYNVNTGKELDFKTLSKALEELEEVREHSADPEAWFVRAELSY